MFCFKVGDFVDVVIFLCGRWWSYVCFFGLFWFYIVYGEDIEFFGGGKESGWYVGVRVWCKVIL